MTIVPKGFYSDVRTGVKLPILVMDAGEILERENLRIANTSESLRARVLAYQATTNGHSVSPTTH
jgi:hypothetical protein